jgi:hypothetical protein
VPRRLVRATINWITTIVAMIFSMYALDAIATIAGLALVASGWLRSMPALALVAFLIATYAFWAIALRSNLRANWALLEQTGTSTNALSKLAYDLMGVTGRGPQKRRWAASAGYVATEVFKEVPYYAGAIGAAVINAELSLADVALFLGGANLGAAAYESGLARVTLLFLRRRPAAPAVTPATVAGPAPVAVVQTR